MLIGEWFKWVPVMHKRLVCGIGSISVLLVALGWDNTVPLAAMPGGGISNPVEWRAQVTVDRSARRAPFVLEPAGPTDHYEVPSGDKELETAILLIQEQDHAAAIPLLERALKRIPTVEAVWEALGWCYYRVGRAQDAERLWLQYYALQPDSPKAHSLLAQMAVLQSNWQKADGYFARSMALDPGNYDIRYWYAQNRFRMGDLPRAREVIEQLVAEDDARYDVKADLARIYTMIQRYEDAMDGWADIVEAIPENLDFRTEYARSLMLVGNLEEADEQARRILAEDPQRASVMNIRADLAELTHRPESMVDSLQRLIRDAEDPAVRAHLRVRLAARYIQLNREDAARWPLDLALEQYQAAIDAVPEYVPWLNQYAQLAVMAKHPARARRVIDHILTENNPYNQQALRTRFELELMARDFDAAERAIDEVYDRFQPRNPYRYLDRARLEVQRGRYREALDELDKLEAAGNRGALLGLLYHGLTESEWMAMTSTRRLQEHLMALRQAGFTFIAPSDVPAYLQAEQEVVDVSDREPWLARQVDQVRYAFTGRRRIRAAEDARPQKVAVVTFDDGLRTSFSLGTPIAEELNIPFGMFVITSIEELNAPMYAAWDEIRAYRETGAWEIGSHLLWANTDKPAGPDPEPRVFTLPNRIWVPERNRLETLREWSRRVRREFEESRARIEQRLGLPVGAPLAVAYPYSEIGQEEGNNVARLLNPIRAILNEASRQYQMGFVVDPRGYTCSDEDLLMVRRYEPAWDEDAETVVEHVLVHHPVMFARRMRAEIATLMGRPYLAERQIDLLRRDGYPDRQLRELIAFTRNRAASAASAALNDPDTSASRRAWLRPSNLYLAGAYRENQSNEQILQDYYELRAGLNLNPVTGIEFVFQDGGVDQTVTTNRWFKTRQTETSSSSESRTETVDGVTSTSYVEVQSTTTREVQTNRVEKTRYKADVEQWRAALTVRLDESTTLGLSAGEKALCFRDQGGREIGRDDAVVASVSVGWRPHRALQLQASYQHDLVPSAQRMIVYDAAGLNAFWKVTDDWDTSFNAQYASYQDKNAFATMSGSSLWQLLERQGIWMGVEGAIYSMDEDSGYYWSPYWDTRYAGVMRMRRAYPQYYFQFDVRMGRQKEKARPAVVNAYHNLKAQAESDGTWDPGPDPNAPWDTFLGLGGVYRQQIWNHLDLIANLSVNFLRDYSEHDLTLGLQYNF
ncbi:MAG: hypothetical protein A2498_09485 [Lentisphaerae bacterium RIFOXYC12_FULL_60_16]|nr:MAG: hypothetical protein A2498_09485 [Lentisphaerae bacterium RIFOXYC12_FULL_60_16]OGV73309.1 MAG: hypothetical protein A2269_06385 [Lentisphaerae bacterium RIFOXYA12_FULL_60_10]